MSTPVDRVQQAFTLKACAISDPIVLALKGSGEFSRVFRLLQERENVLFARYPAVAARIEADLARALDEIEAIATRIRQCAGVISVTDLEKTAKREKTT